MGEPEVTSTPTAASERIVAIDALRGFAVLGILIMNVQSFSMITAAYINPTAYGDLSGINRWVWIISHIIADKKFMTIFAMLFGAGIVLMTGKIEGRGISARGFHYRRTMWLIIIGLAHAYLLWYGDILVTYGLCALLVYLFRKLSPVKLLVIGLAIFAFASLLYTMFGLSMPYWPQEAIQGNMESWRPDITIIAEDIDAHRAGWLGQLGPRASMALFMEVFLFLIQSGWRSCGLMLVGMSFYKWGILTGARSGRFYLWQAAIGFLIGLSLIITGTYKNFAAGWSMEYSMFLGAQYNYWGSIFLANGYIGIIMLVSRCGIFRKLTETLAATGRMALTNYLMQTAICTTIFYGHGFGLYGRLDRVHHLIVILAVWIAQLVWSPLWLGRFRFGPAEWLWRSLTYRRPQPFRLR